MYFLIFSPWRIVEDSGAAFAMGTIGGSIFHGIKGFRNAPSVILFLFHISNNNAYCIIILRVPQDV